MARCWPPPPCPGAGQALLDSLAQLPPCEELDFGELFAGKGAVSRSLGALGYRGRMLDLEIHPVLNLLQPLGMLAALRVALSIKPGGLLWLAPPCSSWVFLTRHSSGRDLCVEGDMTQASIVAQNALVERCCFLMEVASARGCSWIVEQPASSVLWDYPAMRRVLRRHGLERPCVLDMGAFGGTSVKPAHLWGSAPFLALLERTCSGPERLGLRLEGVQTTHRSVDSSGRRRCQGTSQLKGTQAYPWQFGAALGQAFAGHYGPPAAAGTLLCAEIQVHLLAALAERLPEDFSAAWWLSDFLGGHL